MAGHNKWSKVKRLKGALDAKRGKLVSKLAKITLAPKTGSGSPNGNPHLRNAVHAANELQFIITSHDQLHAMGDSLKRAGLEPDSMKLTYLPETAVPVTDDDAAAQFLRRSDALDDNDDVQHVHANPDISETLLVRIGG